MAHERVPTVYASSVGDSKSKNVYGATRPQPSATDLGKRVVFLSTHGDKKEKYGTLRFWGKPEFAKGLWCGVELDEPAGKNNGSVQGIRYFSCPLNCGIFVPLNRVELDPLGQSRIRSKSSASSILEKKARKKYINKTPFFYNTLPRSTSIPALNQGFSTYYNRTSFKHESPEHRISVPTGPLSPSHHSLFKSAQVSQLKKHTSETNLPQKTQIKTGSNMRQPTTPTRSPIRRPLGSCSDANSSASQLTEGPLKSSVSCQDLLFVNKKSPKHITSLSPQSSPPHDSEDGFSFYSSASDLSHRDSSSDSDLTPRSSSNSPCFIDIEDTGINDNAFILTPPTPGSKKSPSQSPTHRVNLPTGLATPTSTLIESSRVAGNNGECRVPSPEHQKSTKRYQNPKNSRPTLDHPLVNGLAANESVSSNKENYDQRLGGVFVCPTSGQEMTVKQPNSSLATDPGILKLQEQMSICLKHQVAMETRLCRMEESLMQLQSVFIKTMEQVQETLKSCQVKHKINHTNEPELWPVIHPQEH